MLVITQFETSVTPTIFHNDEIFCFVLVWNVTSYTEGKITNYKNDIWKQRTENE
jgi:hypothetical protein